MHTGSIASVSLGTAHWLYSPLVQNPNSLKMVMFRQGFLQVQVTVNRVDSVPIGHFLDNWGFGIIGHQTNNITFLLKACVGNVFSS